jgi:D-serine deaminase-like pyridoxal phosphate-dependent protein
VDGVSFEPAITVLSTVIGTYADRAIVDAGNKAISTDAGQPTPRQAAGLAFATAGDEHGRLTRIESDLALPRVGEVVELVPSHCDTTVNLYDAFYLVRNDVVEDVWPIEARGRTR